MENIENIYKNSPYFSHKNHIKVMKKINKIMNDKTTQNQTQNILDSSIQIPEKNIS